MRRKRVNVQNKEDVKIDGKWVLRYNTQDESTIFCNHRRSGMLWDSINRRCKDDEIKLPSYYGCRNIFQDFQYFASWCQDQYGYLERLEGGNFWHIDKDILVPGNKNYGPDTCCFVPPILNSLLTFNKKGINLPPGVTKSKYSGYQCNISIGGKKRYLGTFSTPEEAYNAWKVAKIEYVESILEIYKDMPEKVIAGIRNHMSLL